MLVANRERKKHVLSNGGAEERETPVLARQRSSHVSANLLKQEKISTTYERLALDPRA